MTEIQCKRRALLAATTAGLTGLLAGCSDPGDDEDDEPDGGY